MIYDGYDCVIEKPTIDDIFIAHYGVKGMKWRHKKNPLVKYAAVKTLKKRNRQRAAVKKVTDALAYDKFSGPNKGASKKFERDDADKQELKSELKKELAIAAMKKKKKRNK